MRRLIRFATCLYPAAWRKRYAREFDALLDEVNPRAADLLNVLGGALKMQLTQGGFWKFAAGFALAGALAGGAWGWFGMPDKYQFTGVLSMPPASSQVESNVRLHELQERLLARTSMKEVIEKQNLYEGERSREPLEDVIEKMRVADIRIRPLPSGTFSIDFVYPDRSKAESTVKDLVARMQSAGGLRFLELSGIPVVPNRFLIACFGLGAGLLIGVAIACMMRMRGRTIATSGACGLAGFLLACAISAAIPNSYISDAVVRVPDPGSFEREALSHSRALRPLDREKDLRLVRLGSRGSSTAIHISFAGPNPFVAQSVILDLLQQYAQPLKIEVLDAPNLPQAPAFPNRYTIALLGLSLGLISGAVFAHRDISTRKRA
jgi:hypothetical protein